MCSGTWDSFQGWVLQEILVEAVTQRRAGEREAINQGDSCPQCTSFLAPVSCPQTSPFFSCIGEKVLPPPPNSSQTGSSSVHVNQKDFPNLGAEGRKPAALLRFCTSTCILQTPLCDPFTIKYELVRRTSVISPFARGNPGGGHGSAPSWLRWGISRGFCFLLLLLRVFAVKALAPFADRPSVLPCVCHQDVRLSCA